MESLTRGHLKDRFPERCSQSNLSDVNHSHLRADCQDVQRLAKDAHLRVDAQQDVHETAKKD